MSKPLEKTILVVDDDLAMTSLLRDFLKHEGYQVVTNSSVEGALGWLGNQTSRPDLVLSDVKMGKSSGFDLLRYLTAERPSLPVILFSVLEELEAEAIRSGAKRFLHKPFALAKLASAIKVELNG